VVDRQVLEGDLHTAAWTPASVACDVSPQDLISESLGEFDRFEVLVERGLKGLPSEEQSAHQHQTPDEFLCG